ncbi:MAG: glucosyltransferase domain-containing protein [Saccharofermentans sp.]|nr:glucosyltransferase domain-containing protein [Saccharofermentans sp.]
MAVLFGGSKHFASTDLSVFLLIAYGAGFYLLMLVVIIPVIDLIQEKFTLFGEAGKKNRFLLYFAAFFLLWLPFLILQHVCCCFCFAYAVSFLDRLGTRPVIKYSVAAITLFNPYIIGYVGVALKDIPYSAFALLLTILIAEFCFFPESFGKSFIKMSMLTATVMLVCFMRSNGIYVVVLTAAALIPLIRKDRKKAGFAVVMLAGVILFLISNTVILKTSGTIILENNYKEALSIPFQQTARYVRDNSDDITDEEREIIDRDLNIETLAERYDPRISDPVKNAYEGNKSGIPEYLGVWGKQRRRNGHRRIVYLAGES